MQLAYLLGKQRKTSAGKHKKGKSVRTSINRLHLILRVTIFQFSTIK